VVNLPPEILLLKDRKLDSYEVFAPFTKAVETKNLTARSECKKKGTEGEAEKILKRDKPRIFLRGGGGLLSCPTAVAGLSGGTFSHQGAGWQGILLVKFPPGYSGEWRVRQPHHDGGRGTRGFQKKLHRKVQRLSCSETKAGKKKREIDSPRARSRSKAGIYQKGTIMSVQKKDSQEGIQKRSMTGPGGGEPRVCTSDASRKKGNRARQTFTPPDREAGRCVTELKVARGRPEQRLIGWPWRTGRQFFCIDERWLQPRNPPSHPKGAL